MNKKEHDCMDSFNIDRDPLDYEFYDDYVGFYGQCSECGRKGREVFIFSCTLFDDEG